MEETKKEMETLFFQCQKELDEIERKKREIFDRLKEKLAQEKINQLSKKNE
mgnify:CR=1 FL=1